MNQKVVAIDRNSGGTSASSKVVPANQKAVDALPLGSGTWSVRGVPGLYVRCRAQMRSYFIQRRVNGRLVKETLGDLPLKRAKSEAMRMWSGLKPKPPSHEITTLTDAFEQYLADKDLAPKTRENYRYNFDRYLRDWNRRSLHDIGNDRAGVRRLQRQITKDHGRATWNQVMRLLSAVYRWQRKVDPSLPENPTVAVEAHKLEARDWAISDDDLKLWWAAVKTLSPVKRIWWLTALFSGARKGSIEALQWNDLDLEKRTIRFRVTKGNRPYVVPMSDQLAELLTSYRDSGQVPPSEWVFPSNVKSGDHILGVRNDKDGVSSAHHLRHTFRTTLAHLGVTSDQARMLMGHSMGGDVSRGYITAPLLVESLRPLVNAVAEKYSQVLGELVGDRLQSEE